MEIMFGYDKPFMHLVLYMLCVYVSLTQVKALLIELEQETMRRNQIQSDLKQTRAQIMQSSNTEKQLSKV